MKTGALACGSLLLAAASGCVRVSGGDAMDGGGGAGGGAAGGGANGGTGAAGNPSRPDAAGDAGRFGGPWSDPSAPAGAPDAFGGPKSTDPGARPLVIYPLDGAMLGRNIAGMNIQWQANSAWQAQPGQIFRVRVRGEAGEATFYAGAGTCPMGQCQLRVPDDVWLSIAAANASFSVTLAVDGVPAPGAAVATSDALTLWFSDEDLRGGLYYWSTKLKGTMRVPIGETVPRPFISPGSPGALGSECSGCHTVSRDGCRVATTTTIGKISVVDGKDGDHVLGSDWDTNFQTFSPDDQHLLSSSNGKLILRDGNTGARLKLVPPELIGPEGHQGADQPEWSPDGKSIVLTRGAGFRNDLAGDIVILPWNDGAFAPATVLVPETPALRHYFPAFSPGSDFVIFNSAPQAASARDQTEGRLRLVRIAGGAPIELERATQGTGFTSDWAKFSPFVQRGGNLLFFVFSTKIRYGWLSYPKERPQLWVSALDLTRAGDPSFAPFWLPFQKPDEGNHLGFWTRKVRGWGTVGEIDGD
jgi:hypothetical protein